VFSYILEGCVVDADNDGPSFYIVYSHVAIHIQYILTLAMVGGAARTAAREGGGKITQSEERERERTVCQSSHKCFAPFR
jgi:hypothetical protein